MKQSKLVVRMQRACVGKCLHEVTVRHINGGWNVRVFLNGAVNQETRVFGRTEISKAAREMLRMEDKCGNISELAGAARERGFKRTKKINERV